MLLAIGFLLLVSLVITTVLSAVSKYLGDLLPALTMVWPFVDFSASFILVTALFAMIYKILPDVQITWRDVAIGAALTSALFSVGKFGIGLYLGRTSVAAVYGAAGSVVTILLWVYYSGVIFFLGAEVTQVYAKEYGSGLRPTGIAEKTQHGATGSAQPAR
jgi:membrane protein